jgi:hypothetical protein
MVCVRWEDPIAEEGPWVSPDDLHLKPAYVETLGWVVLESPEYITVASTVSLTPDMMYGDVNVIPRGCIRSIQPLDLEENCGA